MRGVILALPPRDGIAAFTRLYLAVTEGVHEALATARWRDERFVTRLDVVFANLFFGALREHGRDPDAVPKAWAPLLAARRRRGIAQIQLSPG